MADENPRVIWLEHRSPTTGELADALMVFLEDPTGTFGIRNRETGAIVVPAATPVAHVSLGVYEYNIESLDTKSSYEFFFRVVDVEIQEYINGTIQIVTPVATGDGPAIPEGIVGEEIDIDGDGISDGTQYQIDNKTYVDLDGDETIDAVGHDLDRDGTIDGWTPPAKGDPAKTGTFASNELGFDGVDGDIPATGGERSNRNKRGSGYYDGISFKEMCVSALLPADMCVKDIALAQLRAMLFDFDSECLFYTNDILDLLLESSLQSFNATPTFTAFSWRHFAGPQRRFLSVIVKGATVFALFAGGLLQAGSEFTINENGVSFTPPPVSDRMHSYASTLLQHYQDELKEIKSNFKPLPAAVGVHSVLSVAPTLMRLRHLRAKRIY